MKKFKIVLSLFFAAILIAGINGCAEGVLTPEDTIDPNVALVKMWKPDSVYLGSHSISAHHNKNRIQFFENGDYTIYTPTGDETGKWTYKKSDKALIMTGKTTTLAKVKKVTNTSFIYEIEISTELDSGTIFECSAVKGNYVYTLEGNIDNSAGLVLPPRMYVSVFWEYEQNPKAYVVWGQGTVNMQTMKYCINFEEYPKESSTKNNFLHLVWFNNQLVTGNYAVARIVLHTDPNLVNGHYFPNASKVNDFTSSGNFWGCVNDRHIVFVSNNPEEFVDCTISFPAHFETGYNIGKRKTPGSVGPDQIVPLAPTDVNTLKIDKNWDNFVFAKWRY